MPSDCENRVKQKYSPPIMCTPQFCGKRQANIDKSCHTLGWGAGQPFLCDEEKGVGLCYCCCSCFGFDTPIEVTPGVFEIAETIKEGEQIMAAGPSLQWGPRAVAEVTHVADPDGKAIAGLYTVRFMLAGEERMIITSDDDLLMIPTEPRTLKPVKALKAGDALLTAEGGTATVKHVEGGTSARGIASIKMGDFDGVNLEGHLLNVHGLVAADYAVQCYYAGGRLPASLVAEHDANAPDEEDEQWLADPEQWPAGFTPFTRPAIKPPVNAYSFLTQQQAEDVQANAPRTSRKDTIVAVPLLYLFTIAPAFHSDTTCLLDWKNDLPNVYTWEEWGRWIVLVTGGFVRLEFMRRTGLTLALADMLAYQESGIECVGPADLFAATVVMRGMWSDSMYAEITRAGIEQAREVFGYVAPEHAGEGKNICKQPPLDCRLETFAAGLMVEDLPACARPELATI